MMTVRRSSSYDRTRAATSGGMLFLFRRLTGLAVGLALKEPRYPAGARRRAIRPNSWFPRSPRPRGDSAVGRRGTIALDLTSRAGRNPQTTSVRSAAARPPCARRGGSPEAARRVSARHSRPMSRMSPRAGGPRPARPPPIPPAGRRRGPRRARRRRSPSRRRRRAGRRGPARRRRHRGAGRPALPRCGTARGPAARGRARDPPALLPGRRGHERRDVGGVLPLQEPGRHRAVAPLAPVDDGVEDQRRRRAQLVEVRADPTHRVGRAQRVALVALLAEELAPTVLGRRQLDARDGRAAAVAGDDQGGDRHAEQDVGDGEDDGGRAAEAAGVAVERAARAAQAAAGGHEEHREAQQDPEQDEEDGPHGRGSIRPPGRFAPVTPGGSWRDLRPHWAWYLAVPAAAVAGIAVAVVLFVSTVVGAVSSLQSFTAPGARTFALAEGDERGIYLETGGAGAAAGLGGVDCRVVGPDGAAVGLDKVTG